MEKTLIYAKLDRPCGRLELRAGRQGHTAMRIGPRQEIRRTEGETEQFVLGEFRYAHRVPSLHLWCECHVFAQVKTLYAAVKAL